MTQEPFWRDESVTIWHADARSLPLPDASVDLAVTSPPYFGLRAYEDDGTAYDGQIGSEATPDEFLDALLVATGEMVRVLKPGGSIFVNLGDKYGPDKSLLGLPWEYALRARRELGLTIRAEVVWSQPDGMPESVTDRVKRSHEHVFHFTRRRDYYADMDEIREGHAGRHRTIEQPLAERTWKPTVPGNTPTRRSGPDGLGSHPLGKLPGSVWEIGKQPLKVPAHLPQHSAAFPLELPSRIIRGWCPQGGVVLDPFGGSGTTALAAKVLGRRGVLADLSLDYCALSRWRTADPGEIAKAMGVSKPPAAPDGMSSLLDLLGEAS